MGRSATPDSDPRDGAWRDLFWYTTAAAAAAGLAPAAQAQIVTVDLDSEFIQDRGFFVDLDGDGDSEFEFNEDDVDNEGNARDYIRLYQAPEDPDIGEGPDTVTGIVGELVPFGGDNYDYPLPLDVGVTVGPSSEFQDYYLNTFTFEGDDPVDWVGAGERYVGLRISLSDDEGNTTTHYGWALVEVPAQGGAIIAVSAAYNATPDAPITTGDMGTAGEGGPATAGTHRLSPPYPNPSATGTRFDLTVTRAQAATAELYNALGQRVAVLFEGTLAAESARTIDIDGARLPAGLYMVRVSGETFADAFSVTIAR